MILYDRWAFGGFARWTPIRTLPWTRWVASSAPQIPNCVGAWKGYCPFFISSSTSKYVPPAMFFGSIILNKIKQRSLVDGAHPCCTRWKKDFLPLVEIFIYQCSLYKTKQREVFYTKLIIVNEGLIQVACRKRDMIWK